MRRQKCILPPKLASARVIRGARNRSENTVRPFQTTIHLSEPLVHTPSFFISESKLEEPTLEAAYRYKFLRRRDEWRAFPAITFFLFEAIFIVFTE